MKKRSYQRIARSPGIYKILLDGTPSGRYMVSYRIHGMGQRTKNFGTLAEAKRFQAKTRDPERASEFRKLQEGRVLLAEYFGQWLMRRRGRLTQSTRVRYEGVGINYIIPSRLGGLPISQISRDDVQLWISDLEEQGVGAPTIDKAYRTLRACLNEAVLDGKLLSNPAKRIEMPDQRGREPFFLTAEQVNAVANQVPDRDRALVYLLAYTGSRMGEATALRVHHLDLAHGRVTIRENSPEVGGKKLASGKTKTKKVRTVDVPPPLIIELEQHLEQFGPRSQDGSIDRSSYVFIGERGGQTRQNNWRSRVFQPACRSAGITRLGPDAEEQVPRVHDLRHTAASLAAAAGYTLVEVKEMLGHATIKTTADLYLHLFEDGKKAKAKLLGDVMRAARAAEPDVVSLSERRSVRSEQTRKTDASQLGRR